MDQRRVLIVESQNEFALSLAAVLRNQGYATALAQNAAEAQREIEKRRPDLLVLRAELPDVSGFSLCGQLKKQREPVQVVLMSSDAADAFAQHQQGPTPADGYLAIPFAMEELSAVVDKVLLESSPILTAEGDPESDDLDAAMDQSLGLAPKPEAPASESAPPPIPKGPPKLPKRERRSALTDDDRQFLERVFGSIADRKAELLAEAKATKRAPARRELLSSPEGKLTLLREEVKSRESQIARLSEVWAARERELLSVEDRLHDKDVEVQGLKMQIDDLLRRFNEAQEAFVQKEREHGATVDDLLLQRFSSEKDLIEVVASKEKDLNALKRELNHRDDELDRRQVELETAHAQYGELEKQGQVEILQAEVREQGLSALLARREVELDGLAADLDWAVHEALWVREERDARVLALSQDLRDYDNELALIQGAMGTVIHQLTARAEDAEARLPVLWKALAEERAERAAAEADWTALLAEAEDALFETSQLADDLRVQRDGIAQVSLERIETRQAEIERLTRELSDKIRQSETREAELTTELSQKLEHIGELEGEGEALKQHLEERERELNHQITGLITDIEATQTDLEQTRSDLANTQEAKRAGEERLTGEVAAGQEKIAELEQQVVHTREQGEQAMAAEQARAAEELADFKDAAQHRYAEREGELQAQIDAHLAQQTQLREQVGNLEGELAALSQVRAELEQSLAGAHQQGEQLQGDLDAERQERAAAEAKLREQLGDLEGVHAHLQGSHAELEQQHAETRAHAEELSQLLAREKQAHADGLAQAQDALAQRESTLSAEIGELREQVGSLEGQLEAMRAERADVGQQLHDTQQHAAQLQGQLNELGEEKAQLEQALTDTQARLAETSGNLEGEQQAHASLREAQASLEEAHQSLTATHGALQEELGGLHEAHKSLQTQFGEREAKITQVRADFAATETALHAAEDKLVAQSEDAARQLELVSNDLAAHKQALSDTKGKLNATAHEKQRRETELKLELDRRAETIKSLETQVEITQQQGNQKLAELDKKRAELEAALAHTRDHDKKVTATAQELQRRLEAANGQLEALKKDAAGATAQRDQKLEELSTELNKEKAARRKAEAEIQQIRAQADARVREAQQHAEVAKGDASTKSQQLQAQLQQRARKIQEMEQALEQAQGAKSKAERDLVAKSTQAEGREREIMARLQQAMRALKEQEAKGLAAGEEANARAKSEIERRDQQRAAEIQRLQQSLQEKSKALKVAELEVQRLKSKVDAGGARPATSARPGTGGVAARPRPVPPPGARPSSDYEATSMMNRNSLLNMLKEEQTASPPARKPPVNTQPNQPATQAPSSGSIEEALDVPVERTVVMRAPTAPVEEAADDDWASLVDQLDK